MKKLILVVFTTIITLSLLAQSDLIVQTEGQRLYLNHTVVAKENLYSIGRLYNISPRELAPFNGLTIASGLEVNQVVKVPLTADNFVQRKTAGAADDAFVPVFHIVAEKEGLYRVGQNANKVSADNLKEWNGLSNESISVGQNLVVGFLKVKKSTSPLAANSVNKVGGAVPASFLGQNTTAATSTPATVSAPVTTPVNNNPPAAPVVDKQEPVAKQNTDAVQVNNSPVKAGDGAGFFKAVYQQQSQASKGFRNESGNAAVFKSTSGWQDAKYYALMNNIAPGTIVRITNPSTSRTIFAKVLGELPPGKENEGLLIRISNSAAAELKVNEKETKFKADVAYARS